jgi:hypothetical protein
MSSMTLGNNAELCISSMQLPSDQAAIIRATIKNYSSPNTCSETLGWLVFRVINFIKGFFGRSDWQMAIKMIQDNAIHLVNESLRSDSRPTLDQPSKFRSRVYGITNLLASELLTLVLEIHEQKVEVSNRYDRENPRSTISANEIAQMDVIGAIRKLRALEFSPGIAIGRVSILLN